ncbi:hypothetical protein ABH926_008086 [Catenulispora sp. GP43]|uniref:hypothetical protein n=1 Tax=Catenulispora sp. GP43 TaxID=3156263 RepID=UPI003511C46D
MTEFEDTAGPAGRGADEDGPQARELFARTAVQPHRLAFTADDLVAGGRRRVRRRRVAAVVGSTASVAAVAVAATAFAGGGGGRGTVVSAASTTVSSSSSSPAPTSTSTSAAKPPLTDKERTAAEQKLARAVFIEMFGELDPGMKHITHYSSPGGDFAPNGGECVEKTGIQTAYALNGDWTANGKDPFPRYPSTTSPYVQVSAVVYAPGDNVDQFQASDGWGPLTKSTLPDGSVVRAGTTDHGHHVQAVRTLSNGQQILIYALDGSSAPDSKTQPTNPFPFTAAQLSGIVSDVSLPLPFADGFQPHEKCGP